MLIFFRRIQESVCLSEHAFFNFFKPDKFYLGCNGINPKANFRLENSRVCSVLKGNVVYASLKYPSSAIFQYIFMIYIISVLGNYLFGTSPSVTSVCLWFLAGSVTDLLRYFVKC